ncbi:hypothetical protein Geob_2926 [Geotalea daltonii FRC-32]|uniref:Uncharacterized protein n=1 Tax=Geotalea daltonii (strain DSM 22248 / JCM 15807 / FRC-32) TaxID=316067 RepID=B9M2S3_GEODF|nr:hypothetical protein Geob_2926 [Geotalea daltonii FRC-32]
MNIRTSRQFCAICAWRENCAKKFCVSDNGAHCPDFTRDISIKDTVQEDSSSKDKQEE